MTATQVYSPIQTAKGLANRAALMVRRKMFKLLSENVDFELLDQVLDVGVTADRERLESNFFEDLFPYKNRLTCLSDQEAHWLEQCYPGLKFVKGNGLSLPFPDNSFDLVFSNAVLEHVGPEPQQEKFIRECFRCSRRFVFLTTPNRWHPLELHTGLPFLHWLPKKWHRHILSVLGFKQLSKIKNLNLVSRNDLKSLAGNCLGYKNMEVLSVSFLGFPSNLILFVEK